MTLFSDSHQRQKIIRVSNMEEISEKEKTTMRNMRRRPMFIAWQFGQKVPTNTLRICFPNKFWFSYRTKVGRVQIKSRLHICHRRYRSQNPWGLRR